MGQNKNNKVNLHLATKRHQPIRWQKSELKIGDSIVPMSVTRTEGRRTIALSVHPDGKVTVAAPKGQSLNTIIQAVSGKGEWIIVQQEYFRQLHRSWPRQFVSGESYYYLGRQIKLKVIRSRSTERPPQTQMTGGRLIVTIPKETPKDVESAFVRGQLVEWYRERTRTQISSTVARYACLLGLSTPEVRVREFSRRWGSATSPSPKNDRGVLLFNWRIVMAPRRLFDYVAAHEVCHLVHNDHSQDFWRLLSRVMPDYESRRVELAIEGAKFQL